METGSLIADELSWQAVQSNLWGMETIWKARRMTRAGKFNRIYEEWKHRQSWEDLATYDGSIESMRNGNPVRQSRSMSLLSSSIESMRNGNTFNRNDRITSQNSSIESMRNGNLNSPLTISKSRPRSIESMRNGNLGSREVPTEVFTVQSNLWGMETLIPVFGPRAFVHVQSNLWGMETLTSD